MYHAVIMAGGSGTRFWPASRHDRPKQLLDLWGEPMLKSTSERLRALVPLERQWVITGAHLAERVRAVVPGIPNAQIICEPVGRNTAPCIGLAAILLQETQGDCVFGVFPSDHHISGEEAWEDCLRSAFEEARRGPIVTLGIQPTRPETGYGYIRIAGQFNGAANTSPSAHAVEAFVEKPDAATALRYLVDGRHLWNAGIFFFSTATILGEIERQLPALYDALQIMRAAWGTDLWYNTFRDVFTSLEGISIDYGVMEGAREVRVIPASFSWSDVGHWGALNEVLPVDEQGNVARGNVMNLESTNTFVVQTDSGSSKLLVTLGLEDLVVVDSPDALLVCPKSRVQDVRLIVDALQKKGRTKYL